MLVSLAADRVPECVNRCGPLTWADDAYTCLDCGDETDLLQAHKR